MIKIKSVRGSGGGKGGGGGGGTSRVATEAGDTLRSKQIATVIDALSEGPCVGLVNGLYSVYYDETPVAGGTFTGVDVQWRPGTQFQTPLSGVSDIEAETGVNVRAMANVPVARSLNIMEADAVRVTIMIPSLSSQNMANGDISGTSVRFVISVRASGSSFVDKIDDTVSGKTSGSYKRSYLIQLDGNGPWDIRLTRITPDSLSATLNNHLYFDSFTGIINSRLSYPNTFIVGHRIDSANFSAIPQRAYDIKGLIVQVPTNYDPDTRMYSGIWDGSFKLAWTDNPAWCFYDLITNDRYGLGDLIDVASIDKWGLYQIAQYCDEEVPDGFGEVEPRFTCNLYLQSREEAYKVLQNFASIFRGITYWGIGSVIAVQDRPAPAAAIFTNANVADGEFAYQGASIKQRHNVALVAWNDPEDFYRQKIEYVQDDASVIEFGAIQTDIAAFGCASRGQAHRAGRWLLDTEKYATETVSFKAGLDAANVYPGAIIKTSDINRAGTRMGGRIKSGTTSQVILDAPITLSSGVIYTINVINQDNTVHTCGILNGAGTTDTINLLTNMSSSPLPGSNFIMAANNLNAEMWRVIGIKEESTGVVGISALKHEPSLFGSVDFNVKFDAPQISGIKTRPSSPSALNATTSPYVVQNKVVGLRVTLSWYSPAPSFIVKWSNSSGVTQVKTIYESTFDIDNVTLDTYKFTVIAVSALGIESPPATLTYTVNEKTEPPEPLVSLNVVGDMFQNALSWVWADQVDIQKMELWGGGTNVLANSTKLCDLAYPTNTWIHIGLTMGATVYYWARVKDNAGNYSEWSGPVNAATISDPDLINSVLTGQVTASALFSAMSNRITTADFGDPNVLGTWANKIEALKVVNDTNTAAVTVASQAIVTNTGSVVESMTTLQSIVDGQTAAIQTMSSATDGLKASYFVKIDNNGYVTGFGQSSEMVGGAFTSDFTVIADRFAIVTPGQTKKVPFVVGSVNGVTTVGINGATIVDGSISAKSLKVSDLLIQARDSGARMAFTPDVIKVYDDAGVVRVKIGNLLV